MTAPSDRWDENDLADVLKRLRERSEVFGFERRMKLARQNSIREANAMLLAVWLYRKWGLRAVVVYIVITHGLGELLLRWAYKAAQKP